MTEVQPSETRIADILADVRAIYSAAYPDFESGVFTEFDWNRCEAAMAYVSGPRVLDIGVGPGQMFNALARVTDVTELTGIDVKWNGKLIQPERGNLELGNILGIEHANQSFDTVICMEVLEHLEIIDFPKALDELRRVCRGTLVMTVPYNEPEPLWHHDRVGGHRQRFTEERLDRWFPRAERHLVRRKKGTWPWIMLVEHE